MRLFCFLAALLLFNFVHAAETEKSAVRFYPEFVTSFPIVAAVGAGYEVSEKIKVSASYGLVPELYSDVIAQMAASFSGDSRYEKVVKAAFQNNSLIRISASYKGFSGGWYFNLSGMVLNASGRANIDEVMGSSGGSDFTLLRNLLIGSGRGTFVDMTTSLQILELQTGYTIYENDGWQIDCTLGLAKVIGSEVNYKTNLTNFENSASGRSFINSSESETESVIEQYGISPTVGISARYFF